MICQEIVTRPVSLVLMGAAPDTSNLGVSALSDSVILGLAARLSAARVTVFDFGRGLREDGKYSRGASFKVFRYGSVNTRRIHRRESIYNMAVSAALGGCWHPGIKLMQESAAVLDISGGDSFSDIYGNRFFRSNTLRKRLTLRLGVPLILLPQTYGPYKARHARHVAQRIVREAAMAWARDGDSFEVLKDLLGDLFDSARHREGVDVAFGLPTHEPQHGRLNGVVDWVLGRHRPVVGLNVSGLLMNRPEVAHEQYGLKANYREVILSLCRRIIRESDARILLVPHVISPPGHYESDIGACESVAEALASERVRRIAVLPALSDPCEVKWVISNCDWFCGTRMHSTIAALSSGVPTAAIAYSPKTRGVFETCAQGQYVADPRVLDTADVVELLWQAWSNRELARQSLQEALPAVLQRADEQMDEIVSACAGNTDLLRRVRVEK